MKKYFVVGGLVAVALISLSLVGLAFAQTSAPSTPQFPYGPGMMGRGGMMGSGSGYSVMHEYMEEALAKAMNVDKTELEAALDKGQTMWQFAEAKGFTAEQFQQMMQTARQDAIAKMVEDGTITKEQGDWMLNRMQGMWGGQGGYSGGCPGMSGGRWGYPGNTPSSGTFGQSF